MTGTDLLTITIALPENDQTVLPYEEVRRTSVQSHCLEGIGVPPNLFGHEVLAISVLPCSIAFMTFCILPRLVSIMFL